MSGTRNQRISFVVLLFLAITLIGSFTLTPYPGFASPENNDTLIEPESSQRIAITNATATTTNIVLVHGAWADGSSWSKVIPILQNAGHGVVAVQLPLHSIADDVATVKRAVDLVGGPTILVGHSYGGFVITNAGYNNQNVTGLVYLAAFAPDKTESEIMAAVQKPTPTNQSILGEPSGPPAWKQLPTWYQVSESDRIIPPDAQRQFAQRMNATTISVNSSHASPVSHPDEIAGLILDAAGSTG